MAEKPDNLTHNTVHGDVRTVVQAGNVHVHGSSPALPVPRELPCDVRGFAGRAEHLDRLDRLLEADGRALVISALAGAGGVGKTALAVHWAHRVQDRFPDGQLYTNLRGYDPVEPSAEPGLVLEGFLRALNVPDAHIPIDLEARQRLYRSLLADRRVLIVLDNAATADQVRPLLPGSNLCRVVVTSRSALSSLVAREGAHRVTVDVLPLGEAVELLAAELHDMPVAALENLAELCGRLPLALRIIAERAAASNVPLPDLVAELADEQSRLEALSPDPSAVRAVFASSYRALSAEDARTFRLLGLHPGPDISAAAVDALVGGEARRSLQRLVGAHLLEAHGRRYRFHDLVRLYAAECARRDETVAEQREAFARVAGWYVHTVANTQRVLDPHYRLLTPDPLPARVVPSRFRSREEALAWIADEHANLVAVTRRAHDSGVNGPAWQLPALLTRYYMNTHRWEEWHTATHIGLDAATLLGDTWAEAEVLNSLGILFAQKQQHEESFACHSRALDLRRAHGDRHGECVTLNNICFPLRQAGRLERARELLLQGLEVARDIGYAGWLPTLLGNLAGTSGELGRWNESLEWCEQQERAALEQIDHYEDNLLSNRGEACRGLGRLEEAIQCHESALGLVRAQGRVRHPLAQAYKLSLLGRAYRDAGRLQEAVEVLQRAVALCPEYDSGSVHTMCLQDLAEVRSRL
ncbi:ATP-binding protein [Lentzea chajnantorensis]